MQTYPERARIQRDCWTPKIWTMVMRLTEGRKSWIKEFFMREDLILLQGDAESEGGALAILRLDSDVTSELLNNHLRYSKAQAHPTTVAILGLREASEELEQLGDTFSWNTDASILDTAWHGLFEGIKVQIYTHVPLESEFWCIS